MMGLPAVEAFWWIGAFSASVVSSLLLLQLAWEDLESRLVSAGKCYLFVASCLMFQLCMSGTSQIGIGLTWSVIVLAICWLANAIQAKRCRKTIVSRLSSCVSTSAGANVESEVAIGGGDVVCMIGLCLASGHAILLGVLCFFVAVGLFSIAGLVSGRLRATDAIPLVPFFFAWLVPVVVTSLLGWGV